jgi:hypothetical protein
MRALLIFIFTPLLFSLFIAFRGDMPTGASFGLVAAVLYGLWLIPGLVLLNHQCSTVTMNRSFVSRVSPLGGGVRLEWDNVTALSFALRKRNALGDLTISTPDARIVISPGKRDFEKLVAATLIHAQPDRMKINGRPDVFLSRAIREGVVLPQGMPSFPGPPAEPFLDLKKKNSPVFLLIVVGLFFAPIELGLLYATLRSAQPPFSPVGFGISAALSLLVGWGIVKSVKAAFSNEKERSPAL